MPEEILFFYLSIFTKFSVYAYCLGCQLVCARKGKLKKNFGCTYLSRRGWWWGTRGSDGGGVSPSAAGEGHQWGIWGIWPLECHQPGVGGYRWGEARNSPATCHELVGRMVMSRLECTKIIMIRWIWDKRLPHLCGAGEMNCIGCVCGTGWRILSILKWKVVCCLVDQRRHANRSWEGQVAIRWLRLNYLTHNLPFKIMMTILWHLYISYFCMRVLWNTCDLYNTEFKLVSHVVFVGIQVRSRLGQNVSTKSSSGRRFCASSPTCCLLLRPSLQRQVCVLSYLYS